MVAGANCVLAARTELPRESVVELAAAIHEQLSARGAHPAEALRRARAEIARGDTSDPWYWAGLSCYGVPVPPFEPRTTVNAAAWLASGAVVVLCAAGVVWRASRPRASRR
jgi:hypothetical protein